MQSLALFRGARSLSLARRCLNPQRSRLLKGHAISLVRVLHRNQYSSRRHWPPREMSVATNRFATSSSLTSSSLPLPLCELPATQQATLRDLLAWRSWARELAESLGPHGLSADGGPDRRELLVRLMFFLHFFVLPPLLLSSARSLFPSLHHKTLSLQKELDWFLEDAVDSPPWARLQREEEEEAIASSSSSSSSSSVSLRSPLADLSLRWEARIKERVPFQYAVGIAHWRRVTLAVGSGVLCPRPETEQLVDLAVAAFREMTTTTMNTEKSSSSPLSSLPWADLGTGSGAIAVGLALDALVVAGEEEEEGARRQDSGSGIRDNRDASTLTSSPPSSVSPPRVFAVDASPLAASWARLNVSRLGLEKRVAVLEGSWLEPLFEREEESRRTGSASSSSPPSSKQPPPSAFLAGVVSNPPYIPRAQLSTLQREVRDHEPTLALDGGPGAGLDSLRPLCASAAQALACGGFLALETAGEEQASEVASDLLEGSGAFEEVQIHEDLFGVARFVTATRKRREREREREEREREREIKEKN